ncbi:MAG: metal-sensitive transcriptional regulator [Pseudomonadota bacterium]
MKDKAKLSARLKRIEGQVRGVARMVEEDRYCIEILTQIRALNAAIDRVGDEVMRDHLGHCVADAMRVGTEEERRDKIDEIMKVLSSR